MNNRSLQDIINELAPDLREKILNSRNVRELEELKAQYPDDPDIKAVIKARIENINYLVA